MMKIRQLIYTFIVKVKVSCNHVVLEMVEMILGKKIKRHTCVVTILSTLTNVLQ